MKRIILLSLLVVAGTMIIWSQVPQAMNYKAVAKDDWGVALPNKTITLRFTILQGSGSGEIVFQETHLTATNKFGMMDVEIGTGTPVIGAFDMIDWSTGVYYIQIEMDPNGGTSFRLEDPAHQLLSVPFAFYAGSAGNSSSVYYSDLIGAPTLSAVALSGSYLDLTNRPSLFSGDYNDLLNKPTLFSGYYENLLNKPTLFDGTWSSLEGKPVLAPVALSGNYSDLNNKPEGTGIGDILYWSGTEWVVLPDGTDGQILTVIGSIPVWGTGSSQDNGLLLNNSSPLAVETATIILSWECYDPDMRPLFFDVYLAGPSGTVKVGANLITPRVMVTLFEPGEYSWRVCVKDDLDHVTWGALWQFTVSEDAFADGIPEGSTSNDNIELTNPLPLSNIDAELQIAIDSPLDGEAVSTKSPLLKWVCIEPDMRPLFFDVFLAGPSGTKQIGVNLITPSIKTTLFEPGEYSWRVCVKDDLGHVTWGVLWDFTVGVDVFDEDGDGALTPADCNDHDASIFPGAPEICGDGIDQDCNGSDLACPTDQDNDGIPDGSDNCPIEANPNQLDGDGDGIGDACDVKYSYYDWEYGVETIGDQIWMTEDLKTTKLNDGTEIPEIIDDLSWSSLTSSGYCHRYDNNKDCNVLFYNWPAVNTGKLCPIGWHVPSADDWQIFLTYIEEYYGDDASSLRTNEDSFVTWECNVSQQCRNESGFSAFPNGSRNNDGTWSFFNGYAMFWSTTPSSWDAINNMTTFEIDCSRAYLSDASKKEGLNVRCLKD